MAQLNKCKHQLLDSWFLSTVFCKYVEYKFPKAPWILPWINGRYRGRVILDGLVCMFNLLADVVVLKYVNYSEKHNNLVILPGWFSNDLVFIITSSHSFFHPRRHVQTKFNTCPPAINIRSLPLYHNFFSLSDLLFLIWFLFLIMRSVSLPRKNAFLITLIISSSY